MPKLCTHIHLVPVNLEAEQLKVVKVQMDSCVPWNVLGLLAAAMSDGTLNYINAIFRPLTSQSARRWPFN